MYRHILAWHPHSRDWQIQKCFMWRQWRHYIEQQHFHSTDCAIEWKEKNTRQPKQVIHHLMMIMMPSALTSFNIVHVYAFTFFSNFVSFFIVFVHFWLKFTYGSSENTFFFLCKYIFSTRLSLAQLSLT